MHPQRIVLQLLRYVKFRLAVPQKVGTTGFRSEKLYLACYVIKIYSSYAVRLQVD